MAFGDSDLNAFFADFAVPVIWNGVTVPGILDVFTDIFEHGSGPGGFEKVEYILHVPQPALGGDPKAFDPVTILDSPNLPAGFVAGDYTVKSLPKCQDPSICDMVLKGPVS
jgi:hypothetical protein